MRRARPCSGRRRPRQDPRGGRAPLRNRRRDAMRRPRPRPRGRCARCPGSPSPAGRRPVRRLIFKKLEDDAARKIDECAVDLNAGDADDLTEIRPVQPRSPSRLPSEEDSQKARASSRLATLTPIWWTPEATESDSKSDFASTTFPLLASAVRVQLPVSSCTGSTRGSRADVRNIGLTGGGEAAGLP